MPNTFAFIPARGGSQRVKRKNLIEVAGKPLLAHAIECAQKSNLFDAVYVNSEDEEILDVAQTWGAITYKRPQAMGAQEVFLIDILTEMARSLGWDTDDAVGVMLATNPLRLTDDVRGAFALFEQHARSTGVVSVCEYEAPIQLAHFINDKGTMEPFFAEEYLRSTKSTGHEKAYRYNEAIVFNTVDRFLHQRTLVGDKPLPYVMEPARSLSIDYPYQLELVRTALEGESAPKK